MSDIALAPAPVATRSARGRASLIAAGLGVFALIEAVVVLWHPGPPRDHVGYADVAPVRAGLLTYALVDGVLVCSAGTLLLAVALWRSRSVPRWLPIATAALVLAQFAGPQNRLLDGVQGLLMVSYVIVAVFLGRRTLSTH